MDPVALQEKEARLEALLREMAPLVVAFSGGVDSSYLAYKAFQVLGSRSLAVTAESASVPSHQRRMAAEVAARVGFPHQTVATGEVDDERYRDNPPDRCYFCKDELFALLTRLAASRGFAAVADGLNADDVSDYRPGRRAAEEHRVRSPLMEAGLTKEEIRELSRRAGLQTSDQPASACLASRFPYGVRITPEKLHMVDRGEEELRRMGFRIFRVRHHEELVRLEFGPEDLVRALNPEMVSLLARFFKSLGYRYVTIDLEGYRSGSLNEVLVTTIR